MLYLRVITAVIGIPLFLAMLYLGGLPWLILVLIGAVVGARETARLLHRETPIVYIPAMLIAVSVVIGAHRYSMDHVMHDNPAAHIGLVAAAILSLAWTHTLMGRSPAPHWKASVVSALYPGLFLAVFVLLRAVSLPVFLFATIVTWMTDTGAYLIGGRWGRTPLWPSVSPNKTVAGAVGGFVVGIVGGVISGLFWGQQWWLWGCGGGLASIAAQLGDLYESGLKRRSGVKDSGALLPGHGGFLDRFDSLLWSVTAVYLLQHILR